MVQGSSTPTASAFEISNATLNLQSYLLSDVVLRSLNEMSASSGLELVHSTVYSAVGQRSSSLLTSEIGKSASRCLKAIYHEGAYTLPNMRGIVADNSTHCEMPSQSRLARLTEKSVQLAELGVRYLELILRSFVASIFCFLFIIMCIERRKCKVGKSFLFTVRQPRCLKTLL